LIVLEVLFKDKEVKVSYDQYLSLTHTKPLAKCILKLIEKNLTGIVFMNEVELIAKRPRDLSLNSCRTRSL